VERCSESNFCKATHGTFMRFTRGKNGFQHHNNLPRATPHARLSPDHDLRLTQSFAFLLTSLARHTRHGETKIRDRPPDPSLGQRAP
jgi:hypothetical protein